VGPVILKAPKGATAKPAAPAAAPAAAPVADAAPAAAAPAGVAGECRPPRGWELRCGATDPPSTCVRGRGEGGGGGV